MSEEINLEIIRTEEDVLHMLDSILEKRDNEWWDKFYSDKTKPIPFFKNIPDENIVSYVNSGYFKPGKILDIGCGNGRNSIYLAKQGFTVDGMDFSETSINWANEWAKEAAVNINFICTSIFDFEIQRGSYDYIYDGGCLHHIKPHRRNKYLEIIRNSLKSEGLLGLTCFNLKGGANISDYDVYRDFSMHGGIGFSEYKLRKILEPYFSIIELREMIESKDENVFGKEFCWTLLAKKL